MKNKKQFYSGIILLILSFTLSPFIFNSNVSFRFIYGILLGYVIARGRFAFSGSLYRLFHYGTSKTAISFIQLFMLMVLFTGIFLVFDPSDYDLFINPTNPYLILGGIVMGATIVASKHTPTRCASGVFLSYTTSVTSFLLAVFFFGFGIFIAFPLQNPPTNNFVTSGKEIYIPDLFYNNTISIVISVLISLAYLYFLVFLAKKYELHRKKQGTYKEFYIEKIQESEQGYTFFEDVFVDYFSQRTTVILLFLITITIVFITKSYFGFSTSLGIFFGKVLIFFGMPLDSVVNYTNLSPVSFTTPFYNLPFTMQNIGLFIGSISYKLTSCTYFHTFKMSRSTFFSATIGSFILGITTRIIYGCVVGSLFATFASFSLSAWLLMPSIILGGYLGYYYEILFLRFFKTKK